MALHVWLGESITIAVWYEHCQPECREVGCVPLFLSFHPPCLPFVIRNSSVSSSEFNLCYLWPHFCFNFNESLSVKWKPTISWTAHALFFNPPHIIRAVPESFHSLVCLLCKIICSTCHGPISAEPNLAAGLMSNSMCGKLDLVKWEHVYTCPLDQRNGNAQRRLDLLGSKVRQDRERQERW